MSLCQGPLLPHDPIDEVAHRWLMRLLALAGDRVAALQAYRQCKDALRRELSAEPSGETVHTYERISGAEPGSPAPSAERPEPPASPPLVGRQPEWAMLREAWDRTVRGAACFAVVTGDAGIGKSRLAEELLVWAERRGVATAKTRCYAAEGGLSLAPVSEWLRSAALSAHLARLEEVWRVEVARILRELPSKWPDLPRPMPMAGFGDRLRLFEGLARAVLASGQPLLLLIDDLQWCDRETLEWLRVLSRFDSEARLLVLGTARSEELDAAHPLPALLRELRAASQLTEIPLERLDAAETAELAAQVGNRALGAEAASRLYRETAGNPLLIVESVRAESRGLFAYADTLPGSPATRPHLRAAIDCFTETGARLRLPYFLALLADAHLRAGEAEAGLDVVEEALSCARETNQRFWDAELHRLRAELLLRGGAMAADAGAPTRARHRARTAGQVARTARHAGARSAVGGIGQGRRGSRPARDRPLLVHGGPGDPGPGGRPGAPFQPRLKGKVLLSKAPAAPRLE